MSAAAHGHPPPRIAAHSSGHTPCCTCANARGWRQHMAATLLRMAVREGVLRRAAAAAVVVVAAGVRRVVGVVGCMRVAAICGGLHGRVGGGAQ